MIKKNNFLYILLMLTGCNPIHLVQHNMLPSCSSFNATNNNNNNNAALNCTIHPTGSCDSLCKSAQDPADLVRLYFNKLIETFTYVMGLNPDHGLVGGLNTSNGVDAIIDIQTRATEDQISLMQGFATLHATLANRSYRHCTQEELALIATAYSVYALGIAQAATHCAHVACQAVNRLAADPMATPDRMDRTRAAADKAKFVAPIATIAAYLIAAFVAESYAVSHATCNTARADYNAIDMVADADYLTSYRAECRLAAAKAAAEHANKAAEAACTAASRLPAIITDSFVLTIVDSSKTTELINALFRAVDAAAARAKAAAARANVAAVCISVAAACTKADHEFSPSKLCCPIYLA